MSEWGELFLGVIAAATLVMALILIGAVVAAARIGRQARDAAAKAQAALTSAQEIISTLGEEIRPLLTKASAIADEATRAAALATSQVEKIDRLVTDLSVRVEETSSVVQRAIVTPAREGLAVLAAIKAAIATLRVGADWRRRVSRSEEEDPLFIG